MTQAAFFDGFAGRTSSTETGDNLFCLQGGVRANDWQLLCLAQRQSMQCRSNSIF